MAMTRVEIDYLLVNYLASSSEREKHTRTAELGPYPRSAWQHYREWVLGVRCFFSSRNKLINLKLERKSGEGPVSRVKLF